MSTFSLNGNLILKPYNKTRELKPKQAATGFAIAAQKIGVESLELLVDTVLDLGDNEKRTVRKGSKIYFKEETLHIKKWSRSVMESEMFPEGFIVGDMKDILFIEENNK